VPEILSRLGLQSGCDLHFIENVCRIYRPPPSLDVTAVVISVNRRLRSARTESLRQRGRRLHPERTNSIGKNIWNLSGGISKQAVALLRRFLFNLNRIHACIINVRHERND
jgi:hypothetical protein